MPTDYLAQPLSAYLADAAARTPTPGGGSVTALVGALATTMASMAANFTTGAEKFRPVENQIRTDLELLEAARRKFLDLLHRDIEAYADLSAAYKLPKASDSEKATRDAAVQQALSEAMLVPLKSSKVAIQVLEITSELAAIANPNLLSDVAVAAILAEAAYAASRVNVEVNLQSCSNPALVSSTRRELDDGARLAASLKSLCLDTIRSRAAR
jgi:formiminotetrahydrofolate cyclodeaminase